MRSIRVLTILALLPLAGLADPAAADPCGMVPPVYLGDGPPITRIGKQQTYVFYKDGVETFVIRPGFKGKVDEFGMLIPFPNPPAIRKVPDHIFSHIAAAVDPPEVVVDVRAVEPVTIRNLRLFAPANEAKAPGKLAFDTVKVISQEAVGMYEVTVLAAGSAQALKRWLDDHKYKYPTGMDKPCNEYVELGWCFVAIKTKVGQKQGVAPKPGQRTVKSKLPSGSTFDGSVQAMGFRFKSKELVVPMRLSAFNPGELRNIIYILSDGPAKVRGIPEEYVVRQISGEQLYKNLTDPLPLRIIGGTLADIPEYRRKQLPKQRNPVPHNGAAADLFASDLLAVAGGTLSLPHEEEEKQLLRIGERLGLRGGEIDKQNATALADRRTATRKSSLTLIKGMTLTVVDGDFPREVLASQNLTFAEYKMPAKRNRAELYDTKTNKPGGKKAGVLKLGRLDDVAPANHPEQRRDESIASSPLLWTMLGFAALVSLLVVRRRKTVTLALLASLPLAGLADVALADPCGMVPPVYVGPGIPITRVGEQQTYVFYKDGVETFVIRPGFKGKVDEFGMLIPFPNPPAVRKVPDDIFAHLAKAIDPPEVVVDLTIRYFGGVGGWRFLANTKKSEISKDGLAYKEQVRVISQEAVGMYEVTVLEAGSAAALKRWLDEHKYKYPDGMDKPCEEYVKLGWCFVAIKTKVGQQGGVAPKPGQRTVNPKLPAGSTFDGSVQAMGFRFKSDELVVPMRLSSFNAGELRNIVYLLTDGPRRISSIPEEYVVRQISGEQLYKNLTDPLPLRIIGGTAADIPEYRRKQLPKQRDPTPHNGAAKDLFASDLLAISSGELSLAHEEREKQLLRVGERLGLRGSEIDKLNIDSLADERKKTVDRALGNLKNMTLTVIDGDFPREVLAQQNLTFAEYTMPARRNNAMNYDTKSKGPTQKKAGVLKLGRLDDIRIENHPEQRTDESIAGSSVLWITAGFAALLSLIVLRHRKIATVALLAALPLVGLAAAASAQDKDDDAKKTTPTIRQLRNDLSNSDKAAAAVEQLVALGRKAVPELTGEALEGNDLARRGWSIVALSEIGGQDIDELFLKIHKDKQQKMLVRTWAAAGRVYMCNSVDALIEKAALIAAFPAVGRPVGMRIVDKLADDPNGASPELLIGVTLKVPKLDRALAPAIMALGAEKLMKIMATASDQSIRQKATAYVGALAGQDKTVGAAIAKAYTFDPEATDVLWKGGPLYVPGINWSKQDARTVAGNLIRWHLWCDRNGKAAEQRKISINLASIRLFRVAEYQSVGGNGSTVAWLTSWGKAVGRDELEKLLKEQGADKSKKYANVLENL